MVSTPLKNISQNGNLPQTRMKIKKNWNHHPNIYLLYMLLHLPWSLQSFKKTKIASPWQSWSWSFLHPSNFTNSKILRIVLNMFVFASTRFSLNKSNGLNLHILKSAQISQQFPMSWLFFGNFSGWFSKSLRKEIHHYFVTFRHHSPVTRCSPHILTIITTSRWRWRWWCCWSITNSAERTTLGKEMWVCGGCRKFLLLFGRIGPLALRPCALLRA